VRGPPGWPGAGGGVCANAADVVRIVTASETQSFTIFKLTGILFEGELEDRPATNVVLR
jgi:hypothetical protein